MPKPSKQTAALASDRRRRLCDEEGLLPAIAQAMAAGKLSGFTDPESYLQALLEGEVRDDMDSFGWALCPSPKTCARHGKCQRGK